MSPRAACRLERLGFEIVYDYVAGIADWKAAGLPIEGRTSSVQKVGNAIRADVPTCAPTESLGEVRKRTFEAGWQACVVLDCGRLVVGLLTDSAWEAQPTQPVEVVMRPGPATVRPDEVLQGLVNRMSKRDTKLVIVTTPQGELLGVIRRDEAERLLAGEALERIWQDCEGCPGQWRMAAKTG